jgi:nucleoside-triphosphatase
MKAPESLRNLLVPKILLTGPPGCGKTTLIRRVVSALAIPAGGFYTQELRQRGRRVGFEIVTMDGQRAILARVNLSSPHRIGRYGVDLAGLERVAVPALFQAMDGGQLVVVDEIGPMEILSPVFREAVLRVLDSPSPVLASIVRRSIPFTDQLKRRPEVTLMTITRSNREAMLFRVLNLLQGRSADCS